MLHTQLPHDFPIPRLLGFHNIYHRCEPAPAAMYMATLHKLKRDDSLFYLEVRLLWHDSICIAGRQQLHHNVAHSLDKHFPGLSEPVRPESFTPGEFYENVHVPRADKDLLLTVRSDTFECNLYPFQQRAVKWMLDREGVDILEGAKVRPRAETVSGLPPSFIETTDADGRPCFSSPLLRVITSDTSGCSNFHKTLKGGVLAEEMGLGKTVEVISLICLNQRAFHGSKAPHPGDSNGEGLIESGATLIITPPAILQQWKQEISNHAPNLVVFVYNGINDTKLSDGEVLKRLVSADVVLTTYQVLRREIFYAVDPPDRSLRHARKAHSRRSPLVQIFWWRVCLDEAQMVESGVSNAARVAQIIPRQLAWAITGTPLKKDINDVFGLLLFLRCEPFDDSMDIWNRLYQSFKPILKAEILGKIVLRHSKDQIREELRLPAQRRLVLTIPFTAVEEEYYDHLFKLMCDDCGLDAIGGPTRDDWDPARCTEKMRRWLIILRQTCLCPAKGTGGRRQHGPGGNAPLRPISEVLEVMIDQNETQYHFEERSLIQSQIRRGQLMENAQRPKEALALWQGALDKANDLVETCRIQLKAEIEKKNKEKMGQEKVREESQKEKKPPRDKRKTKKDDDDEEEDKKSRQTSYRQRLRFALEIKHTCKFFIGNAYYQIKSNFTLTEPDSDEFGKLEELEGNSYEDAKQIRKELLGEVNKRINQSLAGFRQKANDNDFVKLRKVWTKFEGGFESQKLADRLEGLCRLMNAQTEKYDYYRGLIVKMLTQQLVDEEDDAELQGDEYESSAKLQDDMFSYVEAIRVLHAYIHDTITGQQNTHVYRDVERNRERLKDKERYEVPPELYFKLMDEFDMLRATPELGSLRGLVVDIRSMIVALEWDVGEGRLYAPAELAITKSLLEQTTKLTAQQSKPLPELDREVESLGELFNKRLDYYRQLQQISDTVTPYQEENKGKPLDEEEFEKKLETEDSVLEKISALRARLRYLVYIRDESGAEESSRICIVCQSNIEIGVLTLCGHKYCEVCYGTWWTIHRTCPICKRHLGSKDCYPITYKSKDLVTQEETTAATEKSAGTATPAHPGKNAIYSDISTGAYREIQNIDLQASFSTKIDTLARHLIWLRQHDPGAKTVVFSQYKSFLDILGNALSKFKIGWIGVDSKNGIEQFKRDQAVCQSPCFFSFY